MSTSRRIHGEFLRLLYILALRRTTRYVASLGDDEPGVDAFTWLQVAILLATSGRHWAGVAQPDRPRL